MESPVALKCPNCGSQLREADLNFETGIVRCSYCKALSTLPSAGGNKNAMIKEPARTRPAVPLPPGLTCEQQGLEVVITRKWFSHVVWFMVFFCIAWDSFLIFWYTAAFGTDAPWIFKVFPIAHVAVGLWLTYFVACSFLNSTIIRAGQGSLRISHGPLPWVGNAVLEAGMIDQLYCKEGSSNNRNRSGSNFQLWATMRNGSSRKLIGTVMEAEQVLFLEQSIEKALGIVDRPVAGELPR